VMSFTADEAWGYMPGERSESVFLETWYEGLQAMPQAAEARVFWGRVMQVRSAVSKQLEGMRKDGGIGSSLDAEVDLYCDGDLLSDLQMLGDELRFVLITSEAGVHALGKRPADACESELKGLFIAARASEYAKCSRCWHHREDVGANGEHPDLCGRCVENVSGEGEPRGFA